MLVFQNKSTAQINVRIVSPKSHNKLALQYLKVFFLFLIAQICSDCLRKKIQTCEGSCMCIYDNPRLQLSFLRFGFLRSLSVLVANFKLTFY